MNETTERDVITMPKESKQPNKEQDQLAKDFGQRLAYLRNRKGWSQTEAAKRLGKSQSAYSAWEKGDNVPRFRELPLIKELMETTYQYLYGETDEPHPTSSKDLEKKFEEKRIREVLGINDEEAEILGEDRMNALYSFYRFQLAESLEKRNQKTSNEKKDKQ